MKNKQIIPVHNMNPESQLGIQFHQIEYSSEISGLMAKSNKNEVHRDDYYMFLLLEVADVVFSIDFEENRWQDKTVIYIRPGQVHFVSSIQKVRGWSMAIDSMLVENAYKNFFEGGFYTQKPTSIDTVTMTKLSETAGLLLTLINATQTPFSNGIISNLANVFIGIIAEQYTSQREDLIHKKSRSALIAHQFKSLLSENFKTIKSPVEYARMLNYSLSHLNESVKNVTGFPVSYSIHQQIILEAKRLLYYTDLDVKEIGFQLGYEDHTYFSRLFTKTAGLSPSAFRRKFHV